MNSADEVMTIAAGRLLSNHDVVFAGIGLPLFAAALAKRLHAPDLTIVLEGGIIGTELFPGLLPGSTNEMRAAYGAEMFTASTDIFLLAQRGFFDCGFIGAAQVDMYGNINTSLIGTMDQPRVRLPGTGGANDIISLCNQTLVVTKHERRRFVSEVDFVTSPGFLTGGGSRLDSGLVYGGVRYVVTDLALMDFEPGCRRMRLRGLQPGVSIDDVAAATGFELLLHDKIEDLAEPSATELKILQELTGTVGKAGTGQF